jgi:hypothetical protein
MQRIGAHSPASSRWERPLDSGAAQDLVQITAD